MSKIRMLSESMIGKIAAGPPDTDHKCFLLCLHMDVLYINNRRVACEKAGVSRQNLIQFFQGKGIGLPIGIDFNRVDPDLLVGLDHLHLDPFNNIDQDNDRSYTDDDTKYGQKGADFIPADLFKRKNHGSPHNWTPFHSHK